MCVCMHANQTQQTAESRNSSQHVKIHGKGILELRSLTQTKWSTQKNRLNLDAILNLDVIFQFGCNLICKPRLVAVVKMIWFSRRLALKQQTPQGMNGGVVSGAIVLSRSCQRISQLKSCVKVTRQKMSWNIHTNHSRTEIKLV